MYKITYSSRALKDFAKFPLQIQKKIRGKLEILAKNPFASNQVKALKGSNELYRLRVDDYRVIYYLENKKLIITVIKLGHRKDIYQ